MHPFEEPPGHAVLHRDDGGLGSEQRRKARRQIDQAVSFDSEKDHVGWADRSQDPRHRRARLEIALGCAHLNAALLHGAQVWAASEQSDIEAGARHPCAHVSPDGAGAGDDELHPRGPANVAATTRRCILPVAVRGISVTM